MSLATQMVDDIATVYLNTDEHAASITYFNSLGVQASVKAVIEEYRTDTIRTERGRETVKSCVLHLASTNKVANDWLFDIDADQKPWRIDQESAGIRNDKAGLVAVPLVRRDPVERAAEDYRGR